VEGPAFVSLPSTTLPSLKHCHPDRSVAEWRDLRLPFPALPKFATKTVQGVSPIDNKFLFRRYHYNCN